MAGLVDTAKFAKELAHFKKIALDTSILIYHLEDVQPYSELTEVVFVMLANGSFTGIFSTLSVTELLVKPFAEGKEEQIAACERFIRSLPNTVLVAPGYEIARKAASLRGRYRLRTPDALLLSTALNEKAEAFLTNDTRLRGVEAEGIAILVLDDY